MQARRVPRHLKSNMGHLPFQNHLQKMWRSFLNLSKGQCYRVHFERHCRYFLNCHSAIPPPVLSLYDEFVKRTAPPAMEHPTKRKENRHIKNLFIFLIFKPFICSLLFQIYLFYTLNILYITISLKSSVLQESHYICSITKKYFFTK